MPLLDSSDAPHEDEEILRAIEISWRNIKEWASRKGSMMWQKKSPQIGGWFMRYIAGV